MSHKKFGPNDIFINRVKMHPEWDFFIYNSEIFINNSQNIAGDHSENYRGVTSGSISLYEYNLDRSDSYIYPFVMANSNYKTRFKRDLKNMTGEVKDNVTPWSQYFDSNQNPLPIASSYRMSSSITRQYLTVASHTVKGPHGDFVIEYHNNTSSVLKNMCMQYRVINSDFSTTVPSGNAKSPLDILFDNHINMINIPSAFYGSEIKKGSISLNYYITGTLIASAKDENENGKLISTYGTHSGSTVGYVLYREGIILFPSASHATSSLDSSSGITYDGAADDAKWIYFGHGANEPGLTHPTHASASYSINFLGTTYKNTMTMFCHANKAELNYSNNPTALSIVQSSSIVNYTSDTYSYSDAEVQIKNVASSSFHKGKEEFRKVTYISKVGIYDEDNNLLMTVDLARPYKKEEKDNFTFKIKYDLL